MTGRHRRPSTTSKAVKTTLAASAVTGLTSVRVLAASPADAATEPPSTGSGVIHEASALRPAHQALPQLITVRPGDTLSLLAGRYCGNPADWSGLYLANEKMIGSDYNLIYPGQVLRQDCSQGRVTPFLSAHVISPAPAPRGGAYGHPYSCGDGDNDGWDMPCAQLHRGSPQAPAARPQYHAAAQGSVNPGNYSGFQGCVIARESGGNSQIWNASGHYGLYQFSSSTWAAHGGNPADFGHASVAEQTQVFWNTVRADGTSDWAPYDGC